MLAGLEMMISILKSSIPEDASEKDKDIIEMTIQAIKEISLTGDQKLNDKQVEITEIMEKLKKQLGNKYGNINK